MAEIELNVINKQELSVRIPGIEQIRKETKAWKRRCNEEACKVNWRFTAVDARIKFKCS
jgi:hypothetical protein